MHFHMDPLGEVLPPSLSTQNHPGPLPQLAVPAPPLPMVSCLGGLGGGLRDKPRLLPACPALQPEELTNALEISNIVFTSLFALEMLLKLLVYGPFGYIKNPYNIFDGVIVVIRYDRPSTVSCLKNACGVA